MRVFPLFVEMNYGIFRRYAALSPKNIKLVKMYPFTFMNIIGLQRRFCGLKLFFEHYFVSAKKIKKSLLCFQMGNERFSSPMLILCCIFRHLAFDCSNRKREKNIGYSVIFDNKMVNGGRQFCS